MPKRDLERLFESVQQMAEQLTKGDDQRGSAQLANDLRQSGIDPEQLRSRLYQTAKQLAAKERAAGRPAPIALQQAIEQVAPDDVIPSNETAAKSKMERLLDKFSAPFTLPEQLETARAWRKRGDVAEDESADLDVLEKELKDRLKKEHESEG